MAHLLNSIVRLSYIAIFSALVIGASSKSFLYAGQPEPRLEGEEIIFETDYLQYSIGTDGKNRSFRDKRTGKDYLDPEISTRFMAVNIGRGYVGATEISYKNRTLFVDFGNTGISARIFVKLLPEYIMFNVVSVNNGSVRELQLVNLPLTCADKMSSSLSSTRDDTFAGCVIPLNIKTTSRASENVHGQKAASDRSVGISMDEAETKTEMVHSSNSLIAWCDSRVSLEEGSVAVFGCPAPEIMDVIELIERENELPHPAINGVWAKKSDENRQSYLFIDYSEKTVDEAIDYAVGGGFGYIMIYSGVWSNTDGSYLVNTSNFPREKEGLKEATDKIHSAGLKAGVHTLDRVITKSDPIIHPIPPAGLLTRKENRRTLERDIEPYEAFIPTTTSPRGLLDKAGKHRHFSRDLRIGDEIITYDDLQVVPPYGFTGCTRGAYGTIPAAHRAGEAIDNLAEFIGFFEPDVESELYDKVARNLGEVIDYYGFDMIYPDGIGENLAYYGKEPAWYVNNLAVSKLYNYTRRDILWAHAPVSTWSWHVFSRGNTIDFVTRGMNQHLDAGSITGAGWSEKNLQPFEFGWFGFFNRQLDRDATMPREIEYAYSKACAFNCAMSIETNLSSLRVNGRTKEIFAMMKSWEALKMDEYFSGGARERMKQKGIEFTLGRDAEGNPAAQEIKYGPEKYIGSIDGKANAWSFSNTFQNQKMRVSIKSMPRLGDYGDPENVMLIEPGPLTFETAIQGPMGGGRKSEGMEFNLTVSNEEMRDGKESFKVDATNAATEPDGWGCVEIIMDGIKDITKNRAVGTWVFGDGSGVPVHFVIEDAGRWVVRDFWVNLNFTGWRYVEIPEPAKGEVYGFKYPYNNYWSIRQFDYNRAARIYVFLTGLRPGQEVTCYFTRLEALREKPSVVRNPSLSAEGREVMFPVTLDTEDYLEYDGGSTYRAFTPEGSLKAEGAVTGKAPELQAGENQMLYSCEYSDASGQAAKVEIITVGEPFK